MPLARPLLALGLCLALAPACKKATPEPVVEAAPVSVCGTLPDGSRAFRVLHLNDVYRIEGLADGRGGLARVRTLRRQLEEDCPGAVLLTHAGDALFPSLLSREFDGAQMIDVLNLLDGDAEADDPLMVATFGNHEFDKARVKHAALVQDRVRESQFTWLDTNISWSEADGAPVVQADNLQATRLLDVGGVKVGVFGLTIDNKIPDYVSYIDTDYVGIARTRSADLRERGAEVVIALTHLDAADDARILSALGAAGPDVVLGGHDHVLQSAIVDGRAVLKGDADAARVRTLTLGVRPDGAVTWKADEDGVHLDPQTLPADPDVQARVQAHLDRFEQAYCGEEPGCLTTPLTTTNVDLIAEETRIRRYETNLGDFVTERMAETFPEADVVFVNSGALRLNQDIETGTPINRQIVEEIFAYPAPMHRIRIDAETLQAVLERSVSGWTGQGHWLQVGNVAFRHDPSTESVSDVTLIRGEERTPLSEVKSPIDVVTVNYLLDPEIGDQDGYTMLSMDDKVDDPNDGEDLKDVVLEALRAAGEAGIAPERRGWICNMQETDAPCMLD